MSNFIADPLQYFLLALASIPPGPRRAMLQLLPLIWYGKLDLRMYTVKADSPTGSSSNAVSAQAVVQKDAASGCEQRSGLLEKLLQQNQFASGGLTLMLIGAAAAGARVALSSALRYMRRHFMVTAEIDSRDDAYRWVMHWLSEHPTFKQSTMVSVTTNLMCFGSSVPQHGLSVAAAPESKGPPVAYLPAPGDHLLRHQGRWMCISRHRAQGNPQLAANARLLLETLRISMLGTNRIPLDGLLSEAASLYNRSQASRTTIHSVDQDGYWTQVGSRPIRPLSTVVLPPGQAEALLADCQEFLDSEEWYAHHGIPYRRGYLLYGPPGTGKTSCVMALAGALGLDIYVVTLSSPSMSDETLRSLLNSAGARSILLLEDVDAAFVDRKASGEGPAKLTFSGLLNAIDGVAAQEGRLLFMTTNHLERLSNALIRPGRVDVRCYLGPATRQQAKDLFVSFYRDLPHLGLLLARGTGKAHSAVGTACSTRNVQQETSNLQPLADNPALGASSPTTVLGSYLESSESKGMLAAQGAVAGAAAAAAGQQWDKPGVHVAANHTSKPCYSAKATSNATAILEMLADEFASRLPPNGSISMAQLQGHLMEQRKDPWAAVQSVDQLLQQHAQQPNG